MTDLRALVAANRAGEPVGIPSLCSAHPMVLEACIEEAVATGGDLLVEATCNQVNQEGGYTGMEPADFRRLVDGRAAAGGLGAERLILGGDHLGPNPWRHRSAHEAMGKAAVLVAAYVDAGFGKIHLDASMACAGDPDPLPGELVARRAAALAHAAEEAAMRRSGSAGPLYIIGTEVPVPGGAHEPLGSLAVTRVEDVATTVALHREAFARVGLEAALERVLAIVVQPGVEFGAEQIVDFVPEHAADLAAYAAGEGGLAYEAHSTDYQTEPALRALVASHFPILKVGPALTFAMREAFFALDAIEAELLPAGERAGLRAAFEAAMLRDPRHWQGHHHGDAQGLRLARAFSLSDRSRYYWPVPEVADAARRLLSHLERAPIPLGLLSQHLPRQHDAVRSKLLPAQPEALVRHKVREVVATYARACGADRLPSIT